MYLVISDKSYPRKLAFSYLDELSKEFATSYGAKVEGVRKPYAFVGFGKPCVDHTICPADSLNVGSRQTHLCRKQHGFTKTRGLWEEDRGLTSSMMSCKTSHVS